MARMPRGEPWSVPDPDGELYDREMARLRAQRSVAESSGGGPVEFFGNALDRYQEGPRISRPNAIESFVPVVGPDWEAAADLQDRNYAAAAINGAAAVADLLPVGAAIKGARAASKGIKILKEGAVTAGAARAALKRAGMVSTGEEVHHTIPLNGLGRSTEDFRNHFAFLKVLPKEQHRRLTGSWAGKPRYDPIRRIWYGTTDWMKAVPTALAGHAATTAERNRLPHPETDDE